MFMVARSFKRAKSEILVLIQPLGILIKTGTATIDLTAE